MDKKQQLAELLADAHQKRRELSLLSNRIARLLGMDARGVDLILELPLSLAELSKSSNGISDNNLPEKDRILINHLQATVGTASSLVDLSKLIGDTGSATGFRLNRLIKKGVVSRVGRGLYSISGEAASSTSGKKVEKPSNAPDDSGYVGNTLKVLKLFRKGNPGLPEIEKKTQLTKSSVHRILGILVQDGYLVKVGRGKYEAKNS